MGSFFLFDLLSDFHQLLLYHAQIVVFFARHVLPGFSRLSLHFQPLLQCFGLSSHLIKFILELFDVIRWFLLHLEPSMSCIHQLLKVYNVLVLGLDQCLLLRHSFTQLFIFITNLLHLLMNLLLFLHQYFLIFSYGFYIFLLYLNYMFDL